MTVQVILRYVWKNEIDFEKWNDVWEKSIKVNKKHREELKNYIAFDIDASVHKLVTLIDFHFRV